MKYLTKDEIRRLLVPINKNRDKLLIQLGLVTGCRVSEVVSIRLKNIHPDRIKVWDEKKDCHREVVIDGETRTMLEGYLNSAWKAKPHRHHQLFYFSAKTANRILKRWCEVAGIPKDKAHWHALRHTYIVQSLESGVPLNHIVEQTGDSPNTIISIYGRPGIDARKEMTDKIGAYWKS